MAIRAILFDLDETLHDKTSTVRFVAQKQYCEASLCDLGILRESWVQSCIRLNNQRIEKTDVYHQLQKEFSLSPELMEQLLQEFDEGFGRHAVPFPGAVNLLAMSKARGLKTGMVTNGRDEFQRSKVAGMGLVSYFDSIVTSGGFGAKKPDPAIFLACVQELCVFPEECIFVGDDLKLDVEPAAKLGMISVWKSPDQSQLARFSSNSLEEIDTFIASLLT